MKPEPKVIQEVCSLCGLDWKRHGKNPTAEKCVSLLLDEVRALNAQLAVRPVLPYPWPRPYPVPYVPWWQNTWGGKYVYASNATTNAPRITSGGSLTAS